MPQFLKGKRRVIRTLYRNANTVRAGVPVSGISVNMPKHVGVRHVPVHIQGLMGKHIETFPHNRPGYRFRETKGPPFFWGTMPVVVAQHQHLFPMELGEQLSVPFFPQ